MSPCRVCRPSLRCCFCPPLSIICQSLALLIIAALVSYLLPGAPLHPHPSEASERQRLLRENEKRLQHSEHVLHNFRTALKSNTTESFPFLKENPPRLITKNEDGKLSPGVKTEVGVTVLTTRRGQRMERGVSIPQTRYLTQSVAMLLELLNDTSLARSYRLSVCNVDEDPEASEEARDLEDLVPAWKRFGHGHHEGGQRQVGMWEKYKMDYVFCLNRTLELGAEYVLLVEDDAIAHVQLFHVLEHVLGRVVEGPRGRPVAYIKLYHPQRLLGYINLSVERLPELVALAFTVAAALTWCSLHTHNRRCDARAEARVSSASEKQTFVYEPQTQASSISVSSASASSTSRRKRVVVWLWWAIVVAILALAVGRTNLLELRRLSVQLYQVTPTPSCCTPAVLYTRRGARRLADFFLNVTCTASNSIDMRMDDFRDLRGERGLMVQPNLFSHIGMISSLRNKEVSALVIP